MRNNLLWIGGDHPRHIYTFNNLKNQFNVRGAIIESRTRFANTMMPTVPKNLYGKDKDNFILHFSNRLNTEKKYFNIEKYDFGSSNFLKIRSNQINSKIVRNFVKEINPEICITFGCSILDDELIKILPKMTFNMHGGLSPNYKGTATMFWPFYFLEPNNVGVTFHLLKKNVDSGDIIHQCRPKLVKTDKIHDVACKSVIRANIDLSKLIKKFFSGKKINYHKQSLQGKTFKSSDFKPFHLRVIYNLFNDNIVKEYLEKKIRSKKIKIFNQFS